MVNGMPSPSARPRQPQPLAQRPQVRALTVGEQHGEQGDVGQRGDQRVVRCDGDQAESALSDQRTGEQEQQCRRQDSAGRDAGQRDADQQHHAERKYQRHREPSPKSVTPLRARSGVPTRLPGAPGVKMP
jgi:hypothetical protein